MWSLLAQAGWTMIPLYVCSVLALGVGLHKALQFTLDGVGDTTPLRHLDDPDRSTLVDRLTPLRGPLARVMLVAARTDPARAEGEASRAAVAELDRYEAWLALLGYVAQAAPLFGLLGTVIGMVDLFSSMQMAGSDVSTATLSAGIWKALLTTAAGLIVAIPTLGVHLWLSRRLELLQHRMEEGVGRLLSRVAA
ncbi:MAG: MotA/TolQ/ExbB proton channel family protein [Alphaproteobacteria bacterium]|nr:MotA/TolQ/ExbB proton channel family protein [Alphaproteobacteria bacterium]MCB9698040.1 MotA/TolQ/ExbB proton channel family protein [Alphaproteobacteria bacterium]